MSDSARQVNGVEVKSSGKRRVLTLMEGRKENQAMIDGFADAAKRKGWISSTAGD